MKKFILIFACFILVTISSGSSTDFSISDDDDYDVEYINSDELVFEEETTTKKVEFHDSPDNLRCGYETLKFTTVLIVYQCLLQNNINITSRETAFMTSSSGIHLANKSNNDVTAFSSTYSSQVVNYIPANLENIFPNLTSIRIENGRVKELTQNDLKTYVNLLYIQLRYNDIEILEDGLFDYNHNIMFIGLERNSIFHIGLKVFEHLRKLVSLDLEYNNCISSYSFDNFIVVKEIISKAKETCLSRDYVNINERLKNIEDNLICTSIETQPIFEQRLSNLRSQFRKSNISTSSLLTKRFNTLSNWKSQSIGAVYSKVSFIETYVRDSKSEVLSNINSIKGFLNSIKDDQVENNKIIFKRINDIKSNYLVTHDQISEITKGMTNTLNDQNINSASMSNITTNIKNELDKNKLEVANKISTLETLMEVQLTGNDSVIATKLFNLAARISIIESTINITTSILNTKISTMESSLNAKISNLTSILQDFIKLSTRSSNQFQSELNDRLLVTNYKIDKNSIIQDYSKSMLIGACALLATIVLIIIYKKIIFRSDDQSY